MISPKNVFTIFKKEFLQIMRDKSVLFTNFFIPLFGLPLYLIFVIEASTFKLAKEKAPLKDNTIFSVSYQGDISPSLLNELNKNKKIKLEKLSTGLKEEEITQYRKKFKTYIDLQNNSLKLKDKIKEDKNILKENNDKISVANKQYRLALEKLQTQFDAKNDLHIAIFKSKGRSINYFFYSEEKDRSRAARTFVENVFKDHEKTLIIKFKKEKDIKPSDLDPYHYWDVNLSRGGSQISKVIGIGFGGMILFFLLISVLNPTINTTIGERDQNTFKVLLMNPVSLHEIFLGKYLNVSLQGMLTLVPYSIEFVVAYAWGNSNYLFQSLPEITFLKLFLIFAGTASAALFISSFCFLVCSFAKSRVQAQSLVTFLMFAIIIPIGAIGVMDVKLSHITAFIPLINFPLSTENLILAAPNYPAIFQSIGINILASLGLIWFSLGAFVIQWKGSSDKVGLSDLLSRKKRKTTQLVPAHAFLAFAMAFLGYTYGGTLIGILKIDLFTYLFAPLLFCLGTAVFITNYSKLDLIKTYQWKGLTLSYGLRLIFCAFMLSLSFQLLLRNLPTLEMFKIEFPQIFGSNQFASYLSYFLLFAVIPGFTEEVLFRGIIFKGFRNQYNMMIASVISSLFFAVIHFSMFKWGHTFIVGLFLAYVYEKRGLLSAILFHMAFNSTGLTIGLALPGEIEKVPQFMSYMALPMAIIATWFILKVPKEASQTVENTAASSAA